MGAENRLGSAILTNKNQQRNFRTKAKNPTRTIGYVLYKSTIFRNY